jgi:hypothetical protein
MVLLRTPISWSRKPSTLIGLSIGNRSTKRVLVICNALINPTFQLGIMTVLARGSAPTKGGRNT